MKKKILSLMLLFGILVSSVMPIKATTTYWEQEPNNYRSEAQEFTVDTTPIDILGYVSEVDEKDYFKITADASGVLEVDVNVHANSSSDIDVYIKDSNNRILKKWQVEGHIWDNYYLDIEKGEHIYVYIDHDKGYLTKPYDIYLDID